MVNRHLKSAVLLSIVFLVFIVSPVFSSETYKVGVNDILEIRVLDHPELTIPTTVSADGSITYPYLGSINVKGKTLIEIKDEITKGLSEGYIKYPVVTISIVKSLSRRVYVYGYVTLRGAISYEENMTVLMALSMVGGVSPDGSNGKLKIKRKQRDRLESYKDVLEARLIEGLFEKKEIENMLLLPDDILIIERSKTFLIQGEVAQRGRFNLEDGMTIRKALSLAGGVTPDGRYGTVKVMRTNEGLQRDKNIIEAKLNDGLIESKEVGDTLLQPDDMLIVERSKTFLVQGEVNTKGRFALEKDMTVVRALLQAGGVSVEGSFGRIKLRRKVEADSGSYIDIAESNINDGAIESKEVENMLLVQDDILIVERSKTFLIQGEAANRGRFRIEKDMTVLRGLLQAGGATNDGLFGKIKLRRKQEKAPWGYTDIAESNLNNGVIENRETENTVLNPDDILVIEKNKTYFIYGEVNRTGEFVLKDEMTVFKALTIAGGLTKFGSKGRVKVLRSDDKEAVEIIKVKLNEIIAGDTNADVKLQPGDIIIVSEGIF